MFDANIVPAVEDQRFRPHFQPNLSSVRAVEILG